MRNLISRVFSGATGAPTRSKLPQDFAQRLAKLDRLDPGLGQKATAFVAGQGSADAILPILAAQPEAAIAVLYGGFPDSFYFLRRKTEELAKLVPKDPAMAARAAVVMAAALPEREKVLSGAPGTSMPLRLLATILLCSRPGAVRTDDLKVMCFMAGELGLDDLEVLKIAVHPAHDHWRPAAEEVAVLGSSGLLDKHVDQIGEVFDAANGYGREGLLAQLTARAHHPQVQAVILAGLVDGSTKVRMAAETASDALSPEILRQYALDGLKARGAAERGYHAARLVALAQAGDAQVAAALQTHLEREKAASVKRIITEAAAAPKGQDDAGGYLATDGTRVDLPPLAPVPPAQSKPQLDPAKVQALRDVMDTLWAEWEAIVADLRAKGQAPGKHDWREPHPKSWVDEFVGCLTSDALEVGRFGTDYRLHKVLRQAAYAVSEDLPLRRQFDLLIAAGNSTRDGSRIPMTASGWSVFSDRGLMRWLAEGGDVRTLVARGAHVNAELGKPYRDSLLLEAYLNWRAPDIPDEFLWPYVVTQFDTLDSWLGLNGAAEAKTRGPALELLQSLPKTPERYKTVLLEMACTLRGADGKAASRLLAGAEGLEPLLIDRLSDGKQDLRAGAARMLERHGGKAAVEALEKRLKKEKSEMARAAMLTALSRLGGDISGFLGVGALVSEAEKGLAKVKALKPDWVDFNSLPVLHLQDGTALPPDVPRWWIVLAQKLKQPGGNAMFGMWLDLLRPDDAGRLGALLVEGWVAADTLCRTEEEIEEIAQKRLASYKQRIRPGAAFDEDQWMRLWRADLASPIDSATDDKGVLGLGLRMDPVALARVVRSYLRDHGPRANQAKALLDLAAATDQPEALQVVISAGLRLKQKSVQAHAGELVEAAAERRGWTADELSDRTVPAAGLADDGMLALPIGEEEKPYAAVLGDDMTLSLRAPDGKVIKALPAGKDDITKASKKALTTARKELKQVVTVQTARLGAAMASERAWSGQDWALVFAAHPLMSRLAQRIIWIGDDGAGAAPVAFRPTPEGDCLTVDEDAVEAGGFARIRIAHMVHLGTGAAEAWRAHLTDYELTPLLTQLDRELLPAPTGDALRDGVLVEREGWVMPQAKLAGLVDRYGFAKGEAMDGGSFEDYIRALPSLGMVAVLGFSGSFMGADPHDSAVKGLSIHRLNRRGRALPDTVNWAELPPILMSELRHDYRAIAEGGAFDPDWERAGAW